MDFPSVVEESQVKDSILECYREVEKDSDIFLNRKAHIKFLRRGLGELPSGFQSLDANKPWIIFWILHSLDLLDEELDEELVTNVIDTLKSCAHPNGGYGGGPNQLPHLACSYAAVASIAILGTKEAYESINQEKLYHFLMEMKQEDGSFTVHLDGEIDVRGSYCALAIAKMLNLISIELVNNVDSFIRKCQSFEGGIGAQPFAESHAGYSFCALATLDMINAIDVINTDLLGTFIKRSQCSVTGGFRGRTNKLVDGCYSFWTGAMFPIIRKSLLTGPHFDSTGLQRYILVAAQNSTLGGLADKPGKQEDYYHTCYCLSGLSIAQMEDEDNILGGSGNRLPKIIPSLNIRESQFTSISSFFNQ